MKSINLELKLHCILTKKVMNTKPYTVVSHFSHSKPETNKKRIVNLDTQGNATLKMKDVNVDDSSSLCVQIFIHRKLLSDKHVGTVNVRVSDLVSSTRVKYELIGMSSRKHRNNNGVLEVSAVVLPRYVKPELEFKRVIGFAIGNDIGLFKTVPSFRTPLVSLNWC
ncbi:hypothetical protein RND81_02G042800 [Saponaria officinalis]|uniref:Uncharacterized protein n=1 Tax=Saponaria officinalis TaxID=3572 RepID=A0AAW1MPS8_SAPOF